MADDTSSSTGTTATPGTASDTLMQTISTVNTDGITAVYMSGFVLTLAIWALGAKVGFALKLIRKL